MLLIAVSHHFVMKITENSPTDSLKKKTYQKSVDRFRIYRKLWVILSDRNWKKLNQTSKNIFLKGSSKNILSGDDVITGSGPDQKISIDLVF